MNIVTYCQKVSLSQPQSIEHIFLFKNLTLYQRWQNTTFKHSTKGISGATVTELALVFQKNKCVTVTKLDFVLDNKTVRKHLKRY